MPRTRLIAATGALCLAGAGVIPAVTSSTASAAIVQHPHSALATSAHHRSNKSDSKKSKAGKKSLKFSHEVVVDEQRSGFEPDILIDSHDHMYTSVPNGSSEGTSFIWTSRDHGNSFNLIPGSVTFGKPATCVGGGDTELQLDKANDLFVSDLQNLTNLSNSVTKNGGRTFATTCVGADNTPVDRMWYAVQGTLGKPGFAIYEEYDAVESSTDPSSPGGNQLVEEVSSNGTTFVPVRNPNFTGDCLGGGFYDCVSDDEGISGNQFVMNNGEVVIGHSTSDGNGVEVSTSTPTLKRVGGKIVAASAHWNNVIINKSICPDKPGKAPGICGSTQFVTVSHDSAGNIYASFSSRKEGPPVDGESAQTGPYNVYVAVSKNGGKTFSKPYRVSRGGSNSFSWVTAGSKGRVAMAWYHGNETHQGTGYTFDDLTHAEFSVQVGESLNALSKHPKFTVKTVSEHPIKYGPICTLGLDCTVSGGDRSLGDFLEVSKDNRGALALSYVDDTSHTFTTGTTGFQENGPPVVVRQIHGPALIKGKGNKKGYISGPGKGPSDAMNHVRDPKKDDVYAANEKYTRGGKNLDLRAAAVKMTKNKKALIVKMKVRSLKSLSVSPTLGGTTAEWLTRFTSYDPHTLGNGHVYYAGMESVEGGAPTFYDGDTKAPSQQANVQLSEAISSAHAAKGKYNPKNGKIKIKVPFKDIKGVKRHSKLYSVTALTGTTLASLAIPNKTGVGGQINQIDATTPFDVKINRGNAKHAKPAGAATRTAGGFGIDEQVLTGVLGLAGLALLSAASLAWTRRRRSHGAFAH